MMRLPPVKMLPRRRMVYFRRDELDSADIRAMTGYFENRNRSVYVPPDIIANFAQEAAVIDAQTRRYDPSLGALLDVTENMPYHQNYVKLAEESMDFVDNTWGERAETPALTEHPDVNDWQSWNWAAYATGEDFGDIYVSPFFLGTNAQLETRVIPVPYFQTGTHVRQLLWTAFPNQTPRILYRDRSHVTLLSSITLHPATVMKIFSQSHSSFSDRMERLSARPPFVKPSSATWTFEGETPIDCDWNRWIAGEVVAMTETGRVLFRDMDALRDKAALVGVLRHPNSAPLKERWMSARFAPDHPRIITLGCDRHVGWADVRSPDNFQHRVSFETKSSDPIHAFTQTKNGLLAIASENKFSIVDRRMPNKELAGWAHHHGKRPKREGGFVQLETVNLPGNGHNDSEEWIVATSRYEAAPLVFPLKTSTEDGNVPTFSKAPFSVPGHPNVIDPFNDQLPSHTLRSAKRQDDLDRSKQILGTKARYFPRSAPGEGAQDDFAFGDRLVVWQLSEDGSVWCSGAAFGDSSNVWEKPQDHARTELDYLVADESRIYKAELSEVTRNQWINSHQHIDLSGLLKFALKSISEEEIGQRPGDDAPGLEAGPEDRPRTLYDLLPREPPVYGEDGTFVRPAGKRIVVHGRAEYMLPSDDHRLWTADRPAWAGGIDMTHPYTVWEDLRDRYLNTAIAEIEEAQEREAEMNDEQDPDRDLSFARKLRTESVNRMAGELFLGGTIIMPPIPTVFDDFGPDDDPFDGFHTPLIQGGVKLSEAAQKLRGQWIQPAKHRFTPIKVDARTKRAQRRAREIAEEAGEEFDENDDQREEDGMVFWDRNRSTSRRLGSSQPSGSQRADSQRLGSQRPGSQRPGSELPGSQRPDSLPPRAGSHARDSLPRGSQTPAPAGSSPAPVPLRTATAHALDFIDSLVSSQPPGSQGLALSQSQPQASQSQPQGSQASMTNVKKKRRTGF